MTRSGRQTIVDAGAGDDLVGVRNARGGGLDVSVNGEVTHLTAQQVRDGVTIRGGTGNDRILVADDVQANLRIEGGAGNDRIIGGAGDDSIDGGAGDDHLDGRGGRDTIRGRAGRDTLLGGAGDDYLQGGAGNDTIEGGAGRDTIYGLGGRDTIDGGAGQDYIDGGRGDDDLRGGDGNDILIGGQGQDRLRGELGNDVLAGGDGVDRYDGGAGADRIYAQRDDRLDHNDAADTRSEVDMSGPAPGSTIRIRNDRDDGGAVDPDFAERAASDLDALRSLPDGRGLLADIDQMSRARGHSVTLGESHMPGRNATGFDNNVLADRYPRADGTPGPGASSGVIIDPTDTAGGHGRADWERRPPVVALFHELVHARDGLAGTYAAGTTQERGAGRPTPNYEMSTVGLPHDHDGNPATPDEVRAQPYTENRFRALLGLAPRPRYRTHQ